MSTASCLSCNLNFQSDYNAFVNHMSELHALDSIKCTLCESSEIFDNGLDYSMHYIYKHVEQTSPNTETVSKAPHDNFEPSTSDSNIGNFETNSCPICSYCSSDTDLLNAHVNDHFDVVSDNDPDLLLAKKLDEEYRSAQTEKEFKELQKMYGMDEKGSYKAQGNTAYEKAYSKGTLTLSELYDRKNRLNMNQVEGTEDHRYGLKDLLDVIKELSRRSSDVLDAHFCSNIDFYGTSPADTGFGCGYRNIQMLISALKCHEPYRKCLFGTGAVQVPSIPKIQKLIEDAWQKGFDEVGRKQLNGTLCNSRKWIGATEATCFLASFRIKAKIIDFWKSTGPNGTHPVMIKWIYDHFKEMSTTSSFHPPLYFQHEGHSRTVIGAERTRSGQYRLLLFDPSTNRQKMQLFSNRSANPDILRFLRKNVNDLKKPQFQIVSVFGVMQSDEEYEHYKSTYNVEKIPVE